VKGRVQGVGFRATACTFAERLALFGTVKNLPSGDVEIVAQGPKENLERLVSLLKNEFFISEIIESSFDSSSKSFDSFTISF
jgi:acylphosphatase